MTEVTEPASVVASCSETSEEEKLSPLPEIAIGIDIGTLPCSVSVWNGSQMELCHDTVNEMFMRSTETSNKDDASSSIGVRSDVSVSQKHDEATSFNMKMKLWYCINFHDSTNFPFLMHTLDIKPHPFVDAFVNKLWTTINAVELLEIFLMELKLMVETQLKRPIKNVVFTVPVSFSRYQLLQIHCACMMAGLEVLRLMPQPTAVALSYAQQQLQASSSREDTDSESNKIALIFNMDSGYCDVAVISTSKGKCQIKALAGSTIGGEDLIANMICYLLPDHDNIFKNHVREDEEIQTMAFLRATIQEVILRLSFLTSVEVEVDLGYGMKICKVVEREVFEEINKEVFGRCERLIIGCLLDAKVKVENINDVIIVGGCYHIPKVQNLVTKICKKTELYNGMNPLTAAICGAAEAGAFALGIDNPFGNFELFNFHFTHLSIGIRTTGNTFVPVILRNTPVPTLRRVVLTTIHDNQTEAFIIVYEGEAKKAEKNHNLGYFKITEIPKAPKGIPEIIVWMNIDHKNWLTFIVSTCTDMTIKFDEGQLGWCDESLIRTYGDTMDLVSLFNKEQ